MEAVSPEELFGIARPICSLPGKTVRGWRITEGYRSAWL